MEASLFGLDARMAVDLPPVQSQALPAHPSPLAQGLPRPLGQAYADTLDAWGGQWQSVRVEVAGQQLPVGLQALLNRHNPALARVVAAQNPGAGGRFVFDPRLDPHTARDQLTQADAQVLGVLHSQGLLTAQPHNNVIADGGESSNAGGVFSRHGNVSLNDNAQAGLMAAMTWEKGVDPVALRWLVLSHEAAHIQLLRVAEPFHMNGWSGEQNASMNHLFFSTSVGSSMSASVYAESFADVYGAMMALSVTASAPNMRATLGAFQRMRTDTAATNDALMARLEREGKTPHEAAGLLMDEHHTSPALDHFLADIDQGRLVLKDLTPAQLSAAAQGYASESVVAFQESHAGQALNELAWARGQTVTGQPLPPGSDPLVTQENQRMQGYLGERLAAFAFAPTQEAVRAPGEQADPVMAAMAAQDGSFRAAFWQLSANDRRAVADSLDQGNAQKLPASFQTYLARTQAALDGLMKQPALQQHLSEALQADAQTIQKALASPRGGLPATLGQRMQQLAGPVSTQGDGSAPGHLPTSSSRAGRLGAPSR
jgi:hypothetical protein